MSYATGISGSIILIAGAIGMGTMASGAEDWLAITIAAIYGLCWATVIWVAWKKWRYL